MLVRLKIFGVQYTGCNLYPQEGGVALPNFHFITIRSMVFRFFNLFVSSCPDIVHLATSNSIARKIILLPCCSTLVILSQQ